MGKKTNHEETLIAIAEIGTELKNIKQDCEDIKACMIPNGKERMSAVEDKTDSLRRWQAGIMSVVGAVMTVATLFADKLSQLFGGNTHVG